VNQRLLDLLPYWLVGLSRWLSDKWNQAFGKRYIVLRIGIVGDLSMQDPARLDRCLTECLKVADITVMVGDMHPAYSVVMKHLNANPGRLFTIPGNHDERYDAIGQPREWIHDFPGVVMLIGIDNSSDVISKPSWDIITANLKTPDITPVFVFAHKPISRVVLPDGSESGHILGENGQQGIQDAKNLQDWIKHGLVDLLVCGHYHGLAYMRTSYCDVLVEGRGGAAPELGYTTILITGEGWVMHSVTLR
jgi:predicted phosphodiesterase